ncbi:unnamed protein product [Schistosoma mattheei]|uniref:Uncharacterized protein n=1 Tax=Schistosoma mattheei TaxID=31246 RepID=A0A183NT32_9TREM|nr:unnamed protein product [Schistosoma mattheei]
MVVGGSRQETLNPGFVLLGTRQQGVPVPAHAEEITIPEDVTPEHIPTQIVDYSAQTQSHEHLCAEIKRANVICLVHALDDENSFKQISSYWLPLIRHVSTDADTHIPIVIVGNKLDINHESKLNKMLPLMSEYCEVETCIEVCVQFEVIVVGKRVVVLFLCTLLIVFKTIRIK